MTVSVRPVAWLLSMVLSAGLVAGCASQSAKPAPSTPAAQNPAAPAPAPAKPKLEQTKVRLGIAGAAAAFLPIYAADKLGYFKEEGLDVELVTFQGGQNITQATVGGAIDIGAGGLNAAMESQKVGQDIKAFYGITNVVVYKWWAKPEIKKAADLKGKKIAGGAPGTQPYLLTLHWLKKEGVDPKDVQIVAGGDAQSRLSALQTGQVDAASLSSPGNYAAKRNGMSLVGDLGKYVSGFPHDVYYAKQEYLQKNPETVKAVLRANNKAVKKIREDKATAVAITKEVLKYSDEDAVASWEELKETFPLDGTIAKDGIDFAIELMVASGELKEPLPHDKVIDSTFIKAFSSKP